MGCCRGSGIGAGHSLQLVVSSACRNCYFLVDVLLCWDDAVLAVQQDVFPDIYVPLRTRLRSVIR